MKAFQGVLIYVAYSKLGTFTVNTTIYDFENHTYELHLYLQKKVD